MPRKKTNRPSRTTALLIVAGCLAVTALAYWKNLPGAAIPTPPATLQLTAPPTTAASNNVAPVAPSKDEAAVAPVKETASAPAAKAPATKAPARVVRRDPPAAVTAERHEDAKPASVPDVKVAPARATTYERRVADATALAAQDSDRALVDLQRLAADEPNRPEAYEAMAGISLKNKDYDRARVMISSALDHGGKATFSVIHDHSRGNFDAKDPKATSVGTLTLLADEVRFDAPGDADRFAANWSDVKDTGSNKFFGSGMGGFHVTINAGGKYKNVNLAPESKDKAEGKLILNLLSGYERRRDGTK